MNQIPLRIRLTAIFALAMGLVLTGGGADVWISLPTAKTTTSHHYM